MYIRKNEMNIVIWILTPRSLAGVHQCFGGIMVHHTQLLYPHEEVQCGKRWIGVSNLHHSAVHLKNTEHQCTMEDTFEVERKWLLWFLTTLTTEKHKLSNGDTELRGHHVFLA
jgi:hypothetical protein